MDSKAVQPIRIKTMETMQVRFPACGASFTAATWTIPPTWPG